MHATGPKTLQGKKNSSRNARKHCLLAKDIVITTGPGKDDETESARLQADLWNFWQPVGTEEDRLVKELAGCHWLARRAYRCEKGAVTLGSETSDTNPELSLTEQEMLGFRPPSEARYDLLQSSRGIKHPLRAIEYIKAELLTGSAVEAPPWLLPAGIWERTFGPEARVDILEAEIASLKALNVDVEKKEVDRRAAQRDLAAIPGKNPLDRIQRHQNSNRRHTYKLEARLDQLQARRKEEEAKK